MFKIYQGSQIHVIRWWDGLKYMTSTSEVYDLNLWSIWLSSGSAKSYMREVHRQFLCLLIWNGDPQYTDLDKLRAQCRSGALRRAIPLKRARFGRAILPCKKKKGLDLQVFCRIGKTIKKLQWIPNIIMNTNVLKASKLLYLFIDWETFNQLLTLEQARSVIKALQKSIVVFWQK